MITKIMDKYPRSLENDERFYPCPHCGNKDKIVLAMTEIMEDLDYFIGTRISCNRCKIKIEFRRRTLSNFRNSREVEESNLSEVIEAWNHLSRGHGVHLA